MTDSTYWVDPRHSQLHLEIDHLGGVSVLTACAAGFSGVLRREGSGSIALSALFRPATLASALPEVDTVLKGPAMFAVDSFPEATLAIGPLTTSSPDWNTAVKLIIRGVEMECLGASLRVRTTVNRRGHNVVGIRTSFAIQRSAFGMDIHTPSTLGDEVRLVFNMEASDEPQGASGKPA